MSSYENLYNVRHRKGVGRQRRHASALNGLDSELKGAGHPYDSKRPLFERLMNRASFYKGSRGYVANVSSYEYLYRLCGIKQLAVGREMGWDAHVEANEPAPALHRLVKEDFEDEGDWIPLSRYARGVVTNRRTLTFWTSHPLHTGDIIANAHLIGLTNNWLKRWSVILCCRTKDLTSVHSLRVPTVLDAYTSPVFHPTRDVRKPRFGKAIKLGLPGPCVVGAEEYVLGPIEAEKVFLRPVHIPNNSTPCVHSKSPELCNVLESYYKALP
ncbi:MAG TPA: hypothetical protein VM936_19370 [Pyrinomonadaceae bacterium]|nr:hypothetical protein [Pyrinomonadaceae bacterium]